jgi:TetR/AcrR family transcriptional regulator, regulator of autoinduction and epiphytic fitness
MNILIDPKAATKMAAKNSQTAPPKISFKEQQFKVREDVILDVVTKLLANKGFDLMTMDEVAFEVGLAKASLYKHFESKEILAAAAMTRMLDQTIAMTTALASSDIVAIDKLKAMVKWSIETHLRGDMPLLPSTRSTIRHALMAYTPYMERLNIVSEQLGGWIQEAQKKKQLRCLQNSCCIPCLPVLAIRWPIL